jgi:hypothetical protein
LWLRAFAKLSPIIVAFCEGYFNAPTAMVGAEERGGEFPWRPERAPWRALRLIGSPTDASARYVGEFALGFNPYILNPMCDIPFDEKIAGSLHFTPGQAYEICGNGNRSAVHWDMVLIQRKDWGGGAVWFASELSRKGGLFLAQDLKPLNPKNLKSAFYSTLR